MNKYAYELGQQQALLLMEKEAIDLRKGMASAGIMASLLNPMKSFADEAMLAEAKMLAGKLKPSITKQVDDTIDHLGFFKRQGANLYGTEGIASDLARAQANMNIMQKYKLPSQGGPALEQKINQLKKSIVDTGDVDIDSASQIHDAVKKYVGATDTAIKDYLPPGRLVLNK